MPADGEHPTQWADYYRAVSGRAPRELYRRTVMRFEPAGGQARLAIDLGCGSGVETVDLLSRGWMVLAIDRQAEAIEHIVARVSPEQRQRLRTQIASFEEAELPPADLIWAGLSLPFCPPDTFAAVWSKIVRALKPGGRFAGDFFGPRNAWAGRPGMTFLTREQVTLLCDGLQIEHFVEEEGQRPTALEGVQAFHGYEIAVRKV